MIPAPAPAADRDREDVSTITAVIEAIADANDVDPLEVDSLYETVDLDALGRLFRGGDRSGTVSFTAGGCRVVVTADGDVIATPLDEVGERESGGERPDECSDDPDRD